MVDVLIATGLSAFLAWERTFVAQLPATLEAVLLQTFVIRNAVAAHLLDKLSHHLTMEIVHFKLGVDPLLHEGASACVGNLKKFRLELLV